MIKKVLLLIMLIVFGVSVFSSSIYANDLSVENIVNPESTMEQDSERVGDPYVTKELSYWYSDSTKLGYRSESSTVYIYVESEVSDSNLTKTKLQSYISTAFNKWTCTGLNFAYTSSQSSADIVVKAVSLMDADDIYGLDPTKSGATLHTSETLSYYGSYGSSQKYIYSINTTNLYLIQCPSFSDSDFRLVMVHEMGHALGYYGHYSTGAVMKSSPTTTTPSTNEVRHLSQSYS